MSKFVLADHVKHGLRLFHNTNIISYDALKQMLELILRNIMSKSDNVYFSTLSKSKPDVIKEGYAAMLSLIIQLVRYDVAPSQVQAYCEDPLRFNEGIADIFTEFYADNMATIQAKMELFATTPASISDTKWKLDYIIKTSEMSKLDAGPIYRIQLVTDVYNSSLETSSPKKLAFNCIFPASEAAQVPAIMAGGTLVKWTGRENLLQIPTVLMSHTPASSILSRSTCFWNDLVDMLPEELWNQHHLQVCMHFKNM